MTTSETRDRARPERPLGELLVDLSRETSTLVQQEVALAKTEMLEKASVLAGHAGWVSVGFGLALVGVLAVLTGLVLIVAMILPLWGSALLVGVVTATIGVSLIVRHIRAIESFDLVPRETLETLHESRDWIDTESPR